MSKPVKIEKAIWRKPGELKIFSIEQSVGEDEFIVAPFNISGIAVSVKGKISVVEPKNLDIFLNNLPLLSSFGNESTSKLKYLEKVNKAIASIKKGVFEKVVLARQYYVEQNISLQKIFCQLLEHYPSAFIYCFVLSDGTCMIGASPETLLIKKESKIYTEALGGTAQNKGFSDKEYLEHQQIINDISEKLNSLNYIFTTTETKIKIAGNVSHLSTEFDAFSQNLPCDYLLLKKLHPTAAVCGLPFQPAYNFILEEENFDRKYYSGYLGIQQGADFQYYVNLRSAKLFNNGALLYAGAGINKDSVPESEWQETNEKLNTLLTQMN